MSDNVSRSRWRVSKTLSVIATNMHAQIMHFLSRDLWPTNPWRPRENARASDAQPGADDRRKRRERCIQVCTRSAMIHGSLGNALVCLKEQHAASSRPGHQWGSPSIYPTQLTPTPRDPSLPMHGQSKPICACRHWMQAIWIFLIWLATSHNLMSLLRQGRPPRCIVGNS